MPTVCHTVTVQLHVFVIVFQSLAMLKLQHILIHSVIVVASNKEEAWYSAVIASYASQPVSSSDPQRVSLDDVNVMLSK